MNIRYHARKVVALVAFAALIGAGSPVSLTFSGAPFGAVVSELSSDLGINIVVSKDLTNIPVSVHLSSLEPREALNAIESLVGAREIQESGYILLVPGSQAAQYSSDDSRVYQVASGNAPAVAAALQKLFGTSATVSAVSSHSLIVEGAPMEGVGVQALVYKIEGTGVGVERVMMKSQPADTVIGELQGLGAIPPMASVIAEKGDGALDIHGAADDRAALRDEIATLDVPRPSVRFVVEAVDVTPQEFSQIRGLLWGQVQQAQTTGQLPTIVPGQTQTTFQNRYLPVAMQINELVNENKAYLRKTTNVDVMQGDQVRVDLGEQVPIITQTGGLLQQTSVTFYPVGISLVLTPLILNGNAITAKMDVVDSDIVSQNAQGVPTVASRSVSGGTYSVVQGNAVVLIGYGSDQKGEQVTKVPVLGDLPLLGGFFRNRAIQAETENLVFVVRPQICPCPQVALEGEAK